MKKKMFVVIAIKDSFEKIVIFDKDKFHFWKINCEIILSYLTRVLITLFFLQIYIFNAVFYLSILI